MFRRSKAQTPALTAQEIRRLSLWKIAYNLRTEGFTQEQARRLVFLRYLARMRPQAIV